MKNQKQSFNVGIYKKMYGTYIIKIQVFIGQLRNLCRFKYIFK